MPFPACPSFLDSQSLIQYCSCLLFVQHIIFFLSLKNLVPFKGYFLLFISLIFIFSVCMFCLYINIMPSFHRVTYIIISYHVGAGIKPGSSSGGGQFSPSTL